MNQSPFIVVSGLPGCGKSTVGRQVATRLGLPFIDKDDLLEELFEAKGSGDAAHRRLLSRQADVILQHRAAAATSGAVLVSFWHLPAMPLDSGSPTDWIAPLSKRLAHLRCLCPPALAAHRFLERRRHPGHLDAHRTFFEVLASIETQASFGSLTLQPIVDVDTSRDVDFDSILTNVKLVLALAG
jgi:glucokinase